VSSPGPNGVSNPRREDCTGGSWQLLEFDLDGFSPLTAVTRISIGIDPEEGEDGNLVLDDFAVVPEPGTGFLLALGVTGLATCRRAGRRGR
jgi:hypothetical protein